MEDKFYIAYFIMVLIFDGTSLINPYFFKHYFSKVYAEEKTDHKTAVYDGMYQGLTLVGFLTPMCLFFILNTLLSFFPKKKIWWIRLDSALSIIIFAVMIIYHFKLL